MSRFLGLLFIGVLVTACAEADGGGQKRTTQAREVAAGAARIRGGKFRMDVQIGRSQITQPAKVGTTLVAPNAVVTP